MEKEHDWLPPMSLSPQILVACDFDGTLSSLTDHPSAAVLHPAATKALQKLAALHPQAHLALISGRSLADLSQRLPLQVPALILSGNHGLEISGTGLDWVHPQAHAARPHLDLLKSYLQGILQSFTGAEIEDKGLSITLHYRRLSAEQRTHLIAQVGSHPIPPGLQRHEGKQILEFRPHVDWHKGRALHRIMTHLGIPHHATVYLGDDTTDEDAFRELGSTGITLRVGPADRPTLARFRTDDPADAAHFLDAIATALTAHRSR